MAIDAAMVHAVPPQPSLRRMIVAAMIGNVLEWFDFVVYGFFAVTIAEVFFPAHDPTVSMLMMFGTTLMALTPGYATIGIAAPILITLARLFQGFSVGGEFGSAVSFLTEHAGARRGFSASWAFATGGMITVLASLFGVTLTTVLSHEQLVDWGWRIPYVFGMLVGPAGLYIRS